MINLEIVNIPLALLAIFLIYKGKLVNSLIILASYYCLHYSYLYISIFSSAYSLEDINAMRVAGSGILSKALQILVILTFIVKIELLSKSMDLYSNAVYIIINLLMTIGFITQYVINGNLDKLSLQYFMTLLLFIWIIFISYKKEAEYTSSTFQISILLNLILGVLLASIIFGLYEVWIEKTWAQTQILLNQYVHRSSSLFYNPNLFAYLCSLIYLGLIFISRSVKNQNLKINIIAMGLLFAIFISGSRSIYLFLIISITLNIIISKKITLMCIYPYFLYITSAIVSIFMNFNNSISAEASNKLIINFYFLSQRFYYIPIDLFIYLNNKFGSYLIDNNTTMANNSQLSIEGRFCWGCDNGWIILYKDLGLFGILAFVILFLYVVINIINSKKIHTSNKHLFISSILFIILVGSSLRFQILTVSILTGCFICSLLIFLKNK